jgi:N-acetylglucosaminyl-diphospho-decaprenol L-rhamnosyltransferase
MHVAVCIVAYRNPAEVAACLNALAMQTHGDFRIIVCDNSDDAAHAQLAAALPTSMPGGQAVTPLHAADNPGYAGGVNRCLAAAPDADAWWVLNPDTVPEPDALAALVARLSHGDVAAVGGTLYWPDGRVQGHGGRWRGWLARCESIGNGTALSARVDADNIEASLDYLLGASMLIGRAFLDATGPMREDYFLYAEEVEWCLRAKAAGLRLGFAPGARVLHGQGGTTGSAAALTTRPRLPIFMDERNKLNVVRDIHPLRLSVAIPAALILLLLRYAKRGAKAQLGYALGGWWAGVRDQRGKPNWL